MHRTIKRCGERFEVSQIYEYKNFVFPDSKPQALRRLKTIEKKMDSNPDFADRWYCSKIQDYVDKVYARQLEPEELTETPNTWYLPHFSVATDEKFCLVIDAKAKSHGFSLNDLLLNGRLPFNRRSFSKNCGDCSLDRMVKFLTVWCQDGKSG